MTGTDNPANGYVRLNKYIASSGMCSRREADTLIEEGRVTVDGTVAVQGTRVSPSSLVEVDGKPVSPKQELIYIAYNKPLGITCTTDPDDPDNIIDAIGIKERIFPIGRLDKNSSGLILLTNDGDIVNDLLRAENNHEKEYEVRLIQTIRDPEGFRSRMEGGLPILGQTTLPCEVTVTGPHTFRIILHQGLNRQIRRMCDYLGYKVGKLRRIRFMNIVLGDLPSGQYRYLTSDEIKELRGQ